MSKEPKENPKSVVDTFQDPDKLFSPAAVEKHEDILRKATAQLDKAALRPFEDEMRKLEAYTKGKADDDPDDVIEKAWGHFQNITDHKIAVPPELKAKLLELEAQCRLAYAKTKVAEVVNYATGKDSSGRATRLVETAQEALEKARSAGASSKEIDALGEKFTMAKEVALYEYAEKQIQKLKAPHREGVGKQTLREVKEALGLIARQGFDTTDFTEQMNHLAGPLYIADARHLLGEVNAAVAKRKPNSNDDPLYGINDSHIIGNNIPFGGDAGEIKKAVASLLDGAQRNLGDSNEIAAIEKQLEETLGKLSIFKIHQQIGELARYGRGETSEVKLGEGKKTFHEILAKINEVREAGVPVKALLAELKETGDPVSGRDADYKIAQGEEKGVDSVARKERAEKTAFIHKIRRTDT